MKPPIPFNRPYMTGRELSNIAEAHFNSMLAGDGPFTQRCHRLLEAKTGARRVLLTPSCTAALEMAALLADIGPGDEVIMPSFTFVSTANAFVLRGARPVFVDVRPDTFNIDERKIAERINARTRAIVVVHYAGVPCEMDTIEALARQHGLILIEDAAQALMSTYRGREAGTFGAIGATSFHETKNVIAGEGGAIYVNDPELIERAEIIREKGTNRSQFFRGQVDKYTWCDAGSSFLPGELIAAFLWAQLGEMDAITARRRSIWSHYHSAFGALEAREHLRLPVIPESCTHNAHMYYVLTRDLAARTALIDWLKGDDISAVFHYVPLHRSAFGRQFHAGDCSDLPVTDSVSDRLLRLPMWIGVEEHQDRVIERVQQFFR